MEKKGNKYKNKRVEMFGFKFDSMVELEFYEYLLAVSQGEVKVHPRYLLQEKFETYGEKFAKIDYVLDFEYQVAWKTIVVDIKGKATEVAKIKRKLFCKKYPEITLLWLVKYSGNFVDYFENEKRKKQNRLAKSRGNTNWQL